MPRETTIHKAIARICRELGCRYFKQHGSVYVDGGLPDVYILVPVPWQTFAVPLHVEVKTPGNVPTPRQLRRLQQLDLAGALVFWTDKAEKVREVIELLRTGDPGHAFFERVMHGNRD